MRGVGFGLERPKPTGTVPGTAIGFSGRPCKLSRIHLEQTNEPAEPAHYRPPRDHGHFRHSPQSDWRFARTTGLLLFAIASITDYADGYLARRIT